MLASPPSRRVGPLHLGVCQLRAGRALTAGLVVTGVSGWAQAGLLRTITAMRPNTASSSAKLAIVVIVAKYLVLFSLTGETMKRFVARPSDRAAAVRELPGAAGGSLESYYWMSGQYDGAGVFVLPDSHTMAAVSLAATGSGAFTHFETHALIEAGDLTAIAGRAKGITYQPPGA